MFRQIHKIGVVEIYKKQAVMAQSGTGQYPKTFYFSITCCVYE